MNKEMSMFQQLIFSILMRHKDELYSHLDKIILDQVNETKIEDIIRKMFYEIKMPNMDQKIMAFINNEITSVAARKVDSMNVELRIEKFVEKEIDKRINEALKDHESLSAIQSNRKIKPKFKITKPELLEKLDDRSKLILRFRDGNSERILSLAELAYKLDVSTGTIKQLQSQALRKLHYQNVRTNGADASSAIEYI